MWKLIILGIAAYFLYRLFANDFFKKKKIDEEREKEEKEKLLAKGDMVKDPVCGAYVLKDGAISVKDGDEVWYFCSYECREDFLEKRNKKIKELSKNGEESGDAEKSD